MQVAIVFTAYGSSTTLGNFGPGDRARCSAAQARHLVDEVRCAKYAAPPAPAAARAPAPEHTTPAPKRRAAR